MIKKVFKCKKNILKLILVFFGLFITFLITKSSLAAKNYTISSTANWAEAAADVFDANYSVYNLTITTDISEQYQMYIQSGVTVHVYAQDDSDVITAPSTSDTGSIFLLSGGNLYIHTGITLYSNNPPVIRTVSTDGSNIYINEGAILENTDADKTEGTVGLAKCQTNFYIYGTIYGGVVGLTSDINLYVSNSATYSTGKLKSTYRLYTLYNEFMYKETTSSTTYKYKSWYAEGSTVTLKDALYTKTNYTQSSWNVAQKTSTSATTTTSTDCELSSTFTMNYPTIVYPTFTADSFTITYVLDDDSTNSSSNPESYTVEDSNITLSDATKPGYEFVGWYEEEDFSGSALTTIYVSRAEAITLYPKWEIITYTITYNLNGGNTTDDNPTSYTVENSTITLSDPTREYYSFEGWYVDEDFSGTAVTEIETSTLANVTLYAKWTLKEYTITYELDDGKNNDDNPTSYYLSDSDITLSNPTKVGYNFDGWYTEEDFSGNQIITIYVSNAVDVTLYAKWNIINYTITYELDDGNNNEDNPESYTVNDSDITLSSPTKTGYTFIGWYEEEDFSGTKLTKIAINRLENIIIYAKFITIDYKISYELNGGTNDLGNPDSYTIEDSTISLINPTKTGYTFQGWYTDSSFTDKITTITTSDCTDIILYASWVKNGYTITFDSNGGSDIDSITANYNTTITKPIDPTKEGYTFVDWYTDDTFTNPYTFSVMGSSDITLYAKWTVNSYTLTFDSNGGSDVEAITADFNTDLTTYQTTPILTGYTFIGWYTDGDLTDEYVISTMGSSDLTLYAKWEINSYTITFDSNEGSYVDSLMVDYEGKVSQPTDPTRDGYAFAGWYLDSDLTESYSFDTSVTEDLTLYAKWILVYTSDDDTITASISDLSSILSSSELTSLTSIKVVLNSDSEDIDSSEESAIDEYISSKDELTDVGQYYVNITMYGVSEDDDVYEVSKIQSEASITLSIDDDYTGYSNYGIVSYSEGEIEELDSTYDSDTNELSFSTDEFSTYGIYFYNSSDIVDSSTTGSNFSDFIYYISFLIILIFLIFVFSLFKIIDKFFANKGEKAIKSSKKKMLKKYKVKN